MTFIRTNSKRKNKSLCIAIGCSKTSVKCIYNWTGYGKIIKEFCKYHEKITHEPITK